MIDIKALIKQAKNLSPLPATASRLAHLLSDPDSELSTIVEVVSMDQAIAAAALRAANSAANASLVPARSVRDAVLRLGRGTIMSLAVGSGVQKNLRTAIPQYGLGENDLWRHSVASSLAVEVLGPKCTIPIPPEAFAAALLHDVGKLVMARFLDSEILEILDHAETDGGLDGLAAEAEVLGADHAELGALVAQSWKLSPMIVNGIHYHHRPDEGNDPICDIVAIADDVAWSMEGAPPSRVGKPHAAHPAAASRLGLTDDAMMGIRKACSERFQDVLSRYGM